MSHIEQLQDEIARLRAQLRERTQWQCACGGTDCAGQAENERLRAEVTKLKAHEGDLVIGAAILEGARKQEAREVDQLRARVAELEQDKARLEAGNVKLENAIICDVQTTEHNTLARLSKPIENLINAAESASNASINRSGYSDDSEPVLDSRFIKAIRAAVKEVRAAIDAARDGKGAT